MSGAFYEKAQVLDAKDNIRILWMTWSYIRLGTSGLTLVQEGVSGQEVPRVLTPQSLKCVLESVIEGESGQHH